MSEPIRVEFTPEGVEELRRAFAEVRHISRSTAVSVREDSMDMSRVMREVSTSLSVLGTAGFNVLRLADAFGILDRETMIAYRGLITVVSATAALIRSIPTLVSLLDVETIAHWASAAAKWAEAHATAVLVGVATLGAAIPLIVAAVAAAGIVPAARGMQEGGIVRRPLYALLGEAGPEAVVPLSRLGPATVNIWYPTFRSRSQMDYLVDRLERMGQM